MSRGHPEIAALSYHGHKPVKPRRMHLTCHGSAPKARPASWPLVPTCARRVPLAIKARFANRCTIPSFALSCKRATSQTAMKVALGAALLLACLACRASADYTGLAAGGYTFGSDVSGKRCQGLGGPAGARRRPPSGTSRLHRRTASYYYSSCILRSTSRLEGLLCDRQCGRRSYMS